MSFAYTLRRPAFTRSITLLAMVATLLVLSSGTARAQHGVPLGDLGEATDKPVPAAIDAGAVMPSLGLEWFGSISSDPVSSDVSMFVDKGVVPFTTGELALDLEGASTDGAASQASECGHGDGRIDPSSETDVWQFDGESGDQITIRVTRTSGNLDGWLKLVDNSGRELTFDDDSGGSQNPMIRYRLPRSDRYYIHVSSYRWASMGDYRLDLCVETNDSGGSDWCSNANALANGQVKTGTVSYLTDHVMTYCFSGIRDEWVTIRMSKAGGGDLDPLVRLRLANGHVVADDDSGYGLNSMLVARLTASSWFAVEATRYAGSGAFHLVLERGAKAGPADANTDGCINTMDLLIIQDLLGVASHERDYEAGADVNLDGMINSIDLVAVRDALGICR